MCPDVPLTHEQMDKAMRKIGELMAEIGKAREDAAFWKRRADQRQITINELKRNPPDRPVADGQGKDETYGEYLERIGAEN